MTLEGKIALVTGASRGIGRAIALRLAQEGAQVALLFAGNTQAAQSAADEIRGLGREAVPIQADVSDYDQVQAAYAAVKAQLGVPDILVNNAGITRDKLAMRMSREDFDRVVQVNLSGAFYLIRAALPDFVRRRSGRVINITSVSGLDGNPGQANYSAAKAGLVGLTKSLAREVASRGITVNAVAPGFVKTDMTASMNPETLAQALKLVPMGRPAQPWEIAGAVAFLAGPDAAYLTGQVIRVDGGM